MKKIKNFVLIGGTNLSKFLSENTQNSFIKISICNGNSSKTFTFIPEARNMRQEFGEEMKITIVGNKEFSKFLSGVERNTETEEMNEERNIVAVKENSNNSRKKEVIILNFPSLRKQIFEFFTKMQENLLIDTNNLCAILHRNRFFNSNEMCQGAPKISQSQLARYQNSCGNSIHPVLINCKEQHRSHVNLLKEFKAWNRIVDTFGNDNCSSDTEKNIILNRNKSSEFSSCLNEIFSDGISEKFLYSLDKNQSTLTRSSSSSPAVMNIIQISSKPTPQERKSRALLLNDNSFKKFEKTFIKLLAKNKIRIVEPLFETHENKDEILKKLESAFIKQSLQMKNTDKKKNMIVVNLRLIDNLEKEFLNGSEKKVKRKFNLSSDLNTSFDSLKTKLDAYKRNRRNSGNLVIINDQIFKVSTKPYKINTVVNNKHHVYLNNAIYKELRKETMVSILGRKYSSKDASKLKLFNRNYSHIKSEVHCEIPLRNLIAAVAEKKQKEYVERSKVNWKVFRSCEKILEKAKILKFPAPINLNEDKVEQRNTDTKKEVSNAELVKMIQLLDSKIVRKKPDVDKTPQAVLEAAENVMDGNILKSEEILKRTKVTKDTEYVKPGKAINTKSSPSSFRSSKEVKVTKSKIPRRTTISGPIQRKSPKCFPKSDSKSKRKINSLEQLGDSSTNKRSIREKINKESFKSNVASRNKSDKKKIEKVYSPKKSLTERNNHTSTLVSSSALPDKIGESEIYGEVKKKRIKTEVEDETKINFVDEHINKKELKINSNKNTEKFIDLKKLKNGSLDLANHHNLNLEDKLDPLVEVLHECRVKSPSSSLQSEVLNKMIEKPAKIIIEQSKEREEVKDLADETETRLVVEELIASSKPIKTKGDKGIIPNDNVEKDCNNYKSKATQQICTNEQCEKIVSSALTSDKPREKLTPENLLISEKAIEGATEKNFTTHKPKEVKTKQIETTPAALNERDTQTHLLTSEKETIATTQDAGKNLNKIEINVLVKQERKNIQNFVSLSIDTILAMNSSLKKMQSNFDNEIIKVECDEQFKKLAEEIGYQRKIKEMKKMISELEVEKKGDITEEMKLSSGKDIQCKEQFEKLADEVGYWSKVEKTNKRVPESKFDTDNIKAIKKSVVEEKDDDTGEFNSKYLGEKDVFIQEKYKHSKMKTHNTKEEITKSESIVNVKNCETKTETNNTTKRKGSFENISLKKESLHHSEKNDNASQCVILPNLELSEKGVKTVVNSKDSRVFAKNESEMTDNVKMLPVRHTENDVKKCVSDNVIVIKAAKTSSRETIDSVEGITKSFLKQIRSKIMNFTKRTSKSKIKNKDIPFRTQAIKKYKEIAVIVRKSQEKILENTPPSILKICQQVKIIKNKFSRTKLPIRKPKMNTSKTTNTFVNETIDKSNQAQMRAKRKAKSENGVKSIIEEKIASKIKSLTKPQMNDNKKQGNVTRNYSEKHSMKYSKIRKPFTPCESIPELEQKSIGSIFADTVASALTECGKVHRNMEKYADVSERVSKETSTDEEYKKIIEMAKDVKNKMKIAEIGLLKDKAVNSIKNEFILGDGTVRKLGLKVNLQKEEQSRGVQWDCEVSTVLEKLEEKNHVEDPSPSLETQGTVQNIPEEISLELQDIQNPQREEKSQYEACRVTAGLEKEGEETNHEEHPPLNQEEHVENPPVEKEGEGTNQEEYPPLNQKAEEHVANFPGRILPGDKLQNEQQEVRKSPVDRQNLQKDEVEQQEVENSPFDRQNLQKDGEPSKDCVCGTAGIAEEKLEEENRGKYSSETLETSDYVQNIPVSNSAEKESVNMHNTQQEVRSSQLQEQPLVQSTSQEEPTGCNLKEVHETHGSPLDLEDNGESEVRKLYKKLDGIQSIPDEKPADDCSLESKNYLKTEISSSGMNNDIAKQHNEKERNQLQSFSKERVEAIGTNRKNKNVIKGIVNLPNNIVEEYSEDLKSAQENYSSERDIGENIEQKSENNPEMMNDLVTIIKNNQEVMIPLKKEKSRIEFSTDLNKFLLPADEESKNREVEGSTLPPPQLEKIAPPEVEECRSDNCQIRQKKFIDWKNLVNPEKIFFKDEKLVERKTNFFRLNGENIKLETNCSSHLEYDCSKNTLSSIPKVFLTPLSSNTDFSKVSASKQEENFGIFKDLLCFNQATNLKPKFSKISDIDTDEFCQEAKFEKKNQADGILKESLNNEEVKSVDQNDIRSVCEVNDYPKSKICMERKKTVREVLKKCESLEEKVKSLSEDYSKDSITRNMKRINIPVSNLNVQKYMIPVDRKDENNQIDWENNMKKAGNLKELFIDLEKMGNSILKKTSSKDNIPPSVGSVKNIATDNFPIFGNQFVQNSSYRMSSGFKNWNIQEEKKFAEKKLCEKQNEDLETLNEIHDERMRDDDFLGEKDIPKNEKSEVTESEEIEFGNIKSVSEHRKEEKKKEISNSVYHNIVRKSEMKETKSAEENENIGEIKEEYDNSGWNQKDRKEVEAKRKSLNFKGNDLGSELETIEHSQASKDDSPEQVKSLKTTSDESPKSEPITKINKSDEEFDIFEKLSEKYIHEEIALASSAIESELKILQDSKTSTDSSSNHKILQKFALIDHEADSSIFKIRKDLKFDRSTKRMCQTKNVAPRLRKTSETPCISKDSQSTSSKSLDIESMGTERKGTTSKSKRMILNLTPSKEHYNLPPRQNNTELKKMLLKNPRKLMEIASTIMEKNQYLSFLTDLKSKGELRKYWWKKISEALTPPSFSGDLENIERNKDIQKIVVKDQTEENSSTLRSNIKNELQNKMEINERDAKPTTLGRRRKAPEEKCVGQNELKSINEESSQERSNLNEGSNKTHELEVERAKTGQNNSIKKEKQILQKENTQDSNRRNLSLQHIEPSSSEQPPLPYTLRKYLESTGPKIKSRDLDKCEDVGQSVDTIVCNKKVDENLFVKTKIVSSEPMNLSSENNEGQKERQSETMQGNDAKKCFKGREDDTILGEMHTTSTRCQKEVDDGHMLASARAKLESDQCFTKGSASKNIKDLVDKGEHQKGSDASSESKSFVSQRTAIVPPGRTPIKISLISEECSGTPCSSLRDNSESNPLESLSDVLSNCSGPVSSLYTGENRLRKKYIKKSCPKKALNPVGKNFSSTNSSLCTDDNRKTLSHTGAVSKQATKQRTLKKFENPLQKFVSKDDQNLKNTNIQGCLLNNTDALSIQSNNETGEQKIRVIQTKSLSEILKDDPTLLNKLRKKNMSSASTRCSGMPEESPRRFEYRFHDFRRKEDKSIEMRARHLQQRKKDILSKFKGIIQSRKTPLGRNHQSEDEQLKPKVFSKILEKINYFRDLEGHTEEPNKNTKHSNSTNSNQSSVKSKFGNRRCLHTKTMELDEGDLDTWVQEHPHTPERFDRPETAKECEKENQNVIHVPWGGKS